MRSESEQAVLSTQRFLEDVSSATGTEIPEAVRRRAKELLSSYPSFGEVECPDSTDPSFAEPVSLHPLDSQQRPDADMAAGSRPSSSGFSKLPPYPTESQELEVVVTACWREQGLVWVRDESCRRYALDASTKGVVLSDLTVGQGLSCELVVVGTKMPAVAAARVVPRSCLREEG